MATPLEEAIQRVVSLSVGDRARLLAITMRLVLEAGEMEASTIRNTLKNIEEGG